MPTSMKWSKLETMGNPYIYGWNLEVHEEQR